VTQSAYELKVMNSKTVVWNTGKVMSGQSVHIVYEGSPLRSGESYTWQVRVWDNNGKTSKWSTPSAFQMGLLRPADWRAEWIEPGYVEDTVMRPSPLMRKQFNLTEKISQATVYITTHGLYEAWLNGNGVPV
jgi:alpha-L-rhamnosidase